MGKDSRIAWTDHSFNGWRGCSKVSTGCSSCYAETLSHRNPAMLGEWGPGRPRIAASESMWREPFKWNRLLSQCEVCGEWNHVNETVCQAKGCDGREFKVRRPRVFTASLSDWLDDEDVKLPDGTIDKGGVKTLTRLLDTIRRTPNLDWLMLTKRPEKWDERIRACFNILSLEPEWLVDWSMGTPPTNVWIGVSAENQEWWDKRVPVLLSIPAVCRFVSVEPLLGPIELSDVTKRSDGVAQLGRKAAAGIDWIIYGGESGPKARPCKVAWIRDGVRQCRAAGVACFVKQLGAHVIDRNDAGFEGEGPTEWPMDTHLKDLGPLHCQGAPVRIRLKDRKGGSMEEWPEDLRVREFPEVKS